MKKNFFKVAAVAALSLTGFSALAQEEEATKESSFELSGSVDAYFRANLNAPNSPNADAPSTSFANQDGFALGMANLIASKQIGKVGFVADLVFGPRGTDAVFESTTASSSIVNQLYVTYAPSDAVTLTFGNFNTFLGYEVISPTGNFNYSTSYMFSFGPFSHSGLKADFALDDNWSIMASIMNPTDFTDFNPVGKYTGGLQLGYSDDSGSAYLNALYGPQSNGAEETFQIDLTTGWDLTDTFYLGFNATYNTTKDAGIDEDGLADAGFYGAALYPQVALTDSFSLGLRAEYFKTFGAFGSTITVDGVDSSGAPIRGLDDNFEGSVFATTLTGSYSVGNLTIKPELRLDSAAEESFFEENSLDSDGNVQIQKSLASFVIGAIYSF